MDERTRGVCWWVLAWSGVYGLNLPVALWVGLNVVQTDAGWAGIAAGVLALWVAGVLAGVLHPRVRLRLKAGGVVTAVSQLYPFAQIAAGMAACLLWERATGAAVGRPAPGGPAADALEGFTLTLLTGQVVGGVALLLGWLLCLGSDPPAPTPDDGTED